MKHFSIMLSVHPICHFSLDAWCHPSLKQGSHIYVSVNVKNSHSHIWGCMFENVTCKLFSFRFMVTKILMVSTTASQMVSVAWCRVIWCLRCRWTTPTLPPNFWMRAAVHAPPGLLAPLPAHCQGGHKDTMCPTAAWAADATHLAGIHLKAWRSHPQEVSENGCNILPCSFALEHASAKVFIYWAGLTTTIWCLDAC